MDSEDFRKLSIELSSGNNGKLKSIYQEYAVYCIGKLQFEHRCSREDAEDIYTDAVLNFRDKIVEGKLTTILDLRAYLYGTCKNMLLLAVKKNQKIATAATELNQITGDNDSGADEPYQAELLGLTEKALSQIQDTCRQLLKFFYFEKLSLEEISSRMNLANANVAKVSKSRCFKKLLLLVKDLQIKNNYATIK